MSDPLQEEIDYLKQLGTSKSVIDTFAEDTIHDNFCVIPTPFSEFTKSVKAYSFVASFGGNTVVFTIRKTLSDNEWWIDEEATIDNETFTEHTLFRLNTLAHFDRKYTYALVSPYTYESNATLEEQLQSIANCSILLRY